VSAASSGGRCRATLTLLRTLALYWFVIYPRTRDELCRWTERANAILDPPLREHALAKLREGRMVLEGAAAFAILAAPCHRIDVMRACVTFEVIYEFTDALGEQSVDDPLAHNEQLNRALLAAVEPMTPHETHVRGLSPEDPDYLHELIDACRDGIMRLPQHGAILPTVQRLAAVAAHAQTLNHAGLPDGHQRLARWAASQGPTDATWWEMAAAASSPLGIFALFAAASVPGTSEQVVAGIDAAYFPWIGAVVWLLESLVDHLEDAGTDNLNYFGQYESAEAAARRLVTVSQRASDAAASLPDGGLHVLLLAGSVGLYLSTHEAHHPEVRDVSNAICEAIGGDIGPLMAVLRMRRLAGHLRRRFGRATRSRRGASRPRRRRRRLRRAGRRRSS
jgi:tetraprenyl-beta-curcumene synthase